MNSKKKDKIFVASQNTVRGISRKGKTFFSMETNMAETANRMFVRGVDVVLTGNKSYSRYHDTVDSNVSCKSVLCRRTAVSRLHITESGRRNGVEVRRSLPVVTINGRTSAF